MTAVAALGVDQSAAYNEIILPEVATQPEDQVVTRFVARLVGARCGRSGYQWFFNDEAIEDATRNAFAFDEATEANAGKYAVRFNRFGSVTSLPDVAVHYVINFDTTGAGRIVLTLQDHYAPGTMTVTGVPDEGYSFASWGGDASGDLRKPPSPRISI